MTPPPAAPAATPSVPSPAIWYVDPQIGDDRAVGNQDNPYKTLTQALRQASPGATIYLNPGSYSVESGEVFPLLVPVGVVVIGTPIDRGREVLIVGGGSHSSEGFGAQNVALVLQREVQLRGVTVTNPNPQGTGIWLESVTVAIAQCTLANCGREGIFATGRANPGIVGCLFQQNAASGLSLVRHAKGEIRRCIFRGNGFGMAISDYAAPLLVENQTIDNRSGLVLSGAAQPVLRQNYLEANREYGLAVFGQAMPDLGQPFDPGQNILRDNGLYDLRNTTRAAMVSVGNWLNPTRVSGAVEWRAAGKSAGKSNSREAGTSNRMQRPQPDFDWAMPFIHGLQQLGWNDRLTTEQPDAELDRQDWQNWLKQVFEQVPQPLVLQPLFSQRSSLCRLEAMLSLAQILNLKRGNPQVLQRFRDRAQIPTQAVLPLAAAVQQRLLVQVAEIDRLEPFEPVNRATAAAMLYQALAAVNRVRAIVSPQIVLPDLRCITFADLAGHWAADFVRGMVSHGYLGGWTDGRFAPDEPLSLSDYAALIQTAFGQGTHLPEWVSSLHRIGLLQSLVQVLQLPDGSPELLSRFGDADTVPDSLRGPIAAAVEQGLVISYPDLKLLRLDQLATRAEVAAMTYLALMQAGRVPAIETPYRIDPTQPNQPQPKRPDMPVVVLLDPTYSGNASYVDGLREKAVVLPIAQTIAQALQTAGLEVYLTRSSEEPVELSERLVQAQQLNADLLIGLRTGQAEDPEVSGIAVYSLAAGSESDRLAQMLHSTILQRIDAPDRGVHCEGSIASSVNLPAVQLELGYLTSPIEGRNLQNPNYCAYLSEAIAAGILQYARRLQP